MRQKPQKEDDTRGSKRIGQTWYVRLLIPQDRQADVGQAFQTPSDIKEEHVRTLRTRDSREAIKRRDVELLAATHAVNAKLIAAGFLPIHGDYEPRHAFAWAEPEVAVAEALEFRKEIEAPSGHRERAAQCPLRLGFGSLHNV